MNLIKKNCFALIDDIHNQAFLTFFNYNFDFEKNYFKLTKEFRHMSLFSICLHFLRCTRSCDKKSSYCRVCSRVRENFFFECNAFLNLCLCVYGTYLNMNNSHRIDLDVFLLNAERNLVHYTGDNGNCCFFQFFDYPQELLAAFSSVVVRMYLNYTIKSLSNLLCQVSLSDEKTIITIIIKHALIFLRKFWYESNYKFFYEFFDMFDTVNSSACYKNLNTEPKFGPYCYAVYSLSVSYF